MLPMLLGQYGQRLAQVLCLGATALSRVLSPAPRVLHIFPARTIETLGYHHSPSFAQPFVDVPSLHASLAPHAQVRVRSFAPMQV